MGVKCVAIECCVRGARSAKLILGNDADTYRGFRSAS